MDRSPTNLPTHQDGDTGDLSEVLDREIDREIDRELAGELTAFGAGDAGTEDGDDGTGGAQAPSGRSDVPSDAVDAPPAPRPTLSAVRGPDAPAGSHTSAAERLTAILAKERRRRSGVANDVSRKVRTLSADLAETKGRLAEAADREERAARDNDNLRRANAELVDEVARLKGDLQESTRHVDQLVRWVQEQVADAADIDSAITDTIGSDATTGTVDRAVESPLASIRAIRQAAGVDARVA